MISAMLTIDLPTTMPLKHCRKEGEASPPKLIAPQETQRSWNTEKGGNPSGISTAIDTTVSTLEMHSEDGDDDDDDDHNAILRYHHSESHVG